MLGSCVPDAVGPVVIVTELGAPLDTVQLLQLSWESRLNVRIFVFFFIVVDDGYYIVRVSRSSVLLLTTTACLNLFYESV